mgnify:CR=1 FL=1
MKNVLKSDGTLNDGTFKEWTPFEAYGGIFDGQNYTISGIYFNHTGKSACGIVRRSRTWKSGFQCENYEFLYQWSKKK